MPEFQDKVVIVTGGAKGIGRGICLAFAREGAGVLCADMDESAGARLVAESATLAGEIRFEAADVAHDDTCRDLVETAVSAWGKVDVLCNNVGMQPPSSYAPAHELPEAMWDRIIDVNLKSFFLMTRWCVPHMLRRRQGVIVNIASIQGLQSMKGVAAYAASKGGILALTRQLAMEYGDDDIRIVAINPGAIETRMLEDAVDYRGGDLEQVKVQITQRQPLRRMGQPEDIAEAVLFVASDRASYMTGTDINVDGGAMGKGSWAD